MRDLMGVHLGRPQRWFMKQDIVDGKRDCNSEMIEMKNPLEFVVNSLFGRRER